MTLPRPTTILLALLPCAAPLRAQAPQVPIFRDYPASVRPLSRIVAPRPDTGWRAERWGAQLASEASQGPNFAAAFRLVLLPAGFPMGYQLTILDLTSGGVVWTQVDPEFGAEWRLDSQLLFVDPEEAVHRYQRVACPAGATTLECSAATSYFYHWTGENLVLLDSATVHPVHQQPSN